MNRPNASANQLDASPLRIAATVLICAAVFLVALVGGILFEFNKANILTSIGDGKLEVSLVCICAMAAAACAAVSKLRSTRSAGPRAPTSAQSVPRAAWLLLGLPCFAFLSLLVRWLAVDHGAVAYIDVMLRSFTFIASNCALAAVALAVGANGRKQFWIILACLIAAGTIAAGWGLRDYLVNVVDYHYAGWREFGTASNPDFFAGFLLITIPITAAAFLAASDKSASFLYGLCTALQLAALPTTGSRFALVSLAVEVAAFALGGLLIRRSGEPVRGGLRAKLAAFGAIAVLGALGFARPLLHRLHGTGASEQTNSGAFRLYTWHGASRLAAHYPLTGAGPGLFQYAYPKYAVTGYTALAHSGYLQAVDEIGILGAAALIALFASSIFTGFKAVSTGKRQDHAPDGETPDAILDQLAPGSRGGEALVLVGLTIALVGACVQNLIDSDWDVLISGTTAFIAVGLTLSQSELYTARRSGAAAISAAAGEARFRVPYLAGAMAALALAAFGAAWTIGAWREDAGSLQSAAKTVPLDGAYAGSYGYALAADPAQQTAALQSLMAAARLTPDAVEYRRIADVQSSAGNDRQAIEAVQQGLRYDPHSLPLLLIGAQCAERVGDQSSALTYYNRMASLQLTPYATVPALGQMVEYRYAYADVALGRHNLNEGNAVAAIPMFLRAKAVLDQYRAEGGSQNVNRIASMGAGAQRLDYELQSAYTGCMDGLATAYQKTSQPQKAAAARAEAARDAPLFIARPKPSPPAQ